jgi:putative oxidoreductase
MNWTGNQAGEGFEYHLLAVGMCLAILIGGSGALSADLAISRQAERRAGRVGARRVA